MASVKELSERLKESGDPALALDLLGATTARSSVEQALAALKHAELGDKARPILRERFNFYADNIDKDRGATLREALIKLLVGIGHPDDLDLYQRAISVYEGIPPTPKIDVAQKLRTAALVGISEIDAELAQLYAVKLLGEVGDTSDFSGEPARTALHLLMRYERWQPIYQYVLLVSDYKPEYADVVREALESFPTDFPAALYEGAARRFIERDQPVEQTAIVGWIVEHRRADLYPILESVASKTRFADLHRYTVIQMAAARDPALNERLFALAKFAPLDRVGSFIEALELVPGSDSVLQLLRKRQK